MAIPFTFNIAAEEYSAIANIHTLIDEDKNSLNTLSYSYFFKKLETKGPVDYFGFNQRTNDISVNTSFPDADLFDERVLGVSASHNINNWQLSANYSRYDNDKWNFEDSFYQLIFRIR